jgi:hypothetical protein
MICQIVVLKTESRPLGLISSGCKSVWNLPTTRYSQTAVRGDPILNI